MVAALLSPMLVTLAPGSQLVDSVAVPAKMQLTHEHGHPGPAPACYRSPAAPGQHSRGQADTAWGSRIASLNSAGKSTLQCERLRAPRQLGVFPGHRHQVLLRDTQPEQHRAGEEDRRKRADEDADQHG